LHVAVSIVGFRNPDDIQRCLLALGVSTHADFEVVICENGGREACAALAAVLPAALPGGQPVRAVCAPSNVGYGAGVNLCIEQSPDADAWWVLNPDTEPHPDALERLVARLEAGDCDAVGCTLYRPNGKVQSYGGRWRRWLALPVSIGYGAPLEAPVARQAIEQAQSYLNGAAMLIGRRFLEAAGPMREEYFLYCEEVEWCLRAQARGARLGFAPEALVLHAQGTTTGAGEDHASRPRMPVYLNERNKLLLTRDCFPPALPCALAVALIVLLVRYVRRGAWRQAGYGLAGLWAGLLNQRGRPTWVAP
jgi:GT2 family glycosyltransferase